MAINRAQLVAELEPGLNALFGLEYKTYEDETKMIFEGEGSDKAFEEEVLLTGFGAAVVKDEGGGVSYDSASEAWTARYDHETIALAFSLTEESVEDNLYEKLSARYTKALARSMAHTKNVKGAAILNNAFLNTSPIGDGVELCGSHTTYGGSTNLNSPATAVDMSETSLEAAYITIAGWTDERGLEIAVKPKKLVLPSDLAFVAERTLMSTLRVGTVDNDLNAINSMGAIPGGYAINHFLVDPDAWYLMTDCPNSLKHFTRAKIKTGFEGDFETGNLRYKSRERYSFGASDYRGVYGSEGI